MEFKSYIASMLRLDGVSSDEIGALLQDVSDSRMGDVALPCFKLASRLKKPPQAIALQIAQNFGGDAFVERAQAVNGYVNFFFNRKAAAQKILYELPDMSDEVLKDAGRGRTVCIDYSSINIAKPFHIGHLGTTAIGGSLYKIFKALGYRVVGINHLGDWGTQFGKLIVAFKKWSDRETIEKGGVRALQEIYVRFHREEENDSSLTEQAREWFARLEKGDGEATELFSFFKKITLDEVEKVYRRLNVTFDSYNGESFYNDKMQPVIDALKQKGLAQMSEGALVVDLEQYGMPPCLLVKADGATLYATRDLAAALYRKQTYDFDKCLYVVAYQQNLHFRQLFKVLELAGFDWAKDMVHVAYGMVSLEEGSMSTRKGNAVWLSDVLDKAVEKALDIIATKTPELENKREVAEQIGVGAVMFSTLCNARIKDITFSLDRVLNFDGETAPYLQYTYARCRSIELKIKQTKIAPDFDGLDNDEAWEIVKLAEKFVRTVENAAERYEPSLISNFLIDLAQAFNRFYLAHRVMNEDKGVENARLLLVKTTGGILKRGLALLGIAAPEKM
ncbi:MAG: arginine--tRNA ligase [Clostridia bacterium]|nr:arginine--tRNA ligase [Clostridia bacterium]